MLEAAAHWLSDLPTTLAVTVSLLVGAGLSALGLLVVHPILPHGVRAVHNDVSGFMFTTVGITYAVLLAFVAVAVWRCRARASCFRRLGGSCRAAANHGQMLWHCVEGRE